VLASSIDTLVKTSAAKSLTCLLLTAQLDDQDVEGTYLPPPIDTAARSRFPNTGSMLDSLLAAVITFLELLQWIFLFRSRAGVKSKVSVLHWLHSLSFPHAHQEEV
jgi:hypothetical protein